MADVIKVGGLNATNKAKEKATNDSKKTTKKRSTKSNKTKEKAATKQNVEEELKKMDNLPKEVHTDASVEDGKVQIDLSSIFGEGTYAELEGEDAENFIKEQKLAKEIKEEVAEEETPVEPPVTTPENITNESSKSDDEISPEILSGGNPNCYAYLSLKSTGIYRPDIISFALVTEEGKAFYAEMKEVDIMKVTPSVLVNIIHRKFNLKADDITEGRVAIVGDEKYVRSMLINWIRENFTDKGLTMQIVSDKVVNEFGLFMELLLNGIPIEQYSQMVSPVCIDLNTILANNIDISKPDNMSSEEFIKGYIPSYIAIDIDRLGVTEDNTPREYLGNALVNAQAIRSVFRRLYGFDKEEEHVDIVNKKS